MPFDDSNWNDKFEVKTSSIKQAGKGLFAKIKIDKGEHIGYYTGKFLTAKQTEREPYISSKYLMTVTKNYVTQQLPDEFDVSKTDKIDLLNRSVDYFKKHENFVQQEFVEEVFQQPEVIDSFRRFNEKYFEEMDLTPTDNFEISSQAVKKQVRIFKSVLKLDKNFHIYIHGNRSLIEKGTENDGRKFYKIYYDQEQ